MVQAGSKGYLLQLVVVDTHERNLSAAALVELVAARLAAEPLEQQLPAEVAEGQREEGLSHLQGATVEVLGRTAEAQEILSGSGEFLGASSLTKLCVVRGTFSRTSTWSSSPVSHEISVSQPIGFFSLRKQPGTVSKTWGDSGVFEMFVEKK